MYFYEISSSTLNAKSEELLAHICSQLLGIYPHLSSDDINQARSLLKYKSLSYKDVEEFKEYELRAVDDCLFSDDRASFTVLSYLRFYMVSTYDCHYPHALHVEMDMVVSSQSLVEKDSKYRGIVSYVGLDYFEMRHLYIR